jgi:hypothetical protein
LPGVYPGRLTLAAIRNYHRPALALRVCLIILHRMPRRERYKS